MTLETAPLYLVAVLVLGLLLGVGIAVRRVAPGARRFGHALDDIVGEPARPGVDARPGLVERMANVEKHLSAGFDGHTARLERIETAVAGITDWTARLDEHGHRLDEHSRRMDLTVERLDRLAARVARDDGAGSV